MSQTLDRRINAFRPDLADHRLRGRVEASRFVEGEPARIVRAAAPLRRAPEDGAMQETEALMGEDVRIFERRADGWAWVQLEADGYVGWMRAEALAARGPAPGFEVAVPLTLLFPGPDIKRPPLAHLPMGARLTAMGEAADHNATYALVAPDGAVVRQHLRPLGEREADFAAVAERFRGAPYLWGGKTVSGIDCSGLVQVALAAAGIAALRDTDMQERALGTALGEDERLRRGDLVFWRGHVGLMLDAETLLHANAFHMMTAAEPLANVRARAEAKGSPVTSVRRL